MSTNPPDAGSQQGSSSLPGTTTTLEHSTGKIDDQDKISTSTTTEKNGAGDGDSEEQHLESHEVIELQTFSERKAWIEEKIKFLENLPPIEVFSGLDSLREQAEECPNLPSREKLQQWMAEHDVIEKETEIFDTGELKKLRQLTKAATQRNLSPADTDLIEITLTTIYALDKLLHLLRDRSENLELLGIRLDWEENRTNSWKERSKILEDLDTFIKTRARWSPTIYESGALFANPPPTTGPTTTLTKPEDSPILSRRGSVASLASVASESSSFSIGNNVSRGARFKLAELLARDAAQFGIRITGLCHGRVTNAGRLLDKLIDHSRRPVPDPLLDEQDRLEEKTTQELENVGKFAMALSLQWRKADEIYVETMKDQSTARELYEEVQTAKWQHPSQRQVAAFASRVDSVLKRLSLRGNPSSRITTFPKPEHPLFPDQADENDALCQVLSAEITTANKLAEQADQVVKEYKEYWEAIKRVETTVGSAKDLSASFSSILQRLREGVPAENTVEGSPPDLTSEACLDPSRHAVFLALLPSILTELGDVTTKADEVIKDSHLFFDILDNECVDPVFKSNSTSAIQGLISLRDEAKQISELVSERAARLKETRQISGVMDTVGKEMERVRDKISQSIERMAWKKEDLGSRNGAPPTPESPAAELTPIGTTSVVHASIEGDLDSLNKKLTDTVDAGVSALTPHLGADLQENLLNKAKNLRNFYEALLSMQEVAKAVQDQSESMSSIRDEYNAHLLRIEDVKQRFSTLSASVLSDRISEDDSKAEELSIKSDLGTLQDEVSDFIDGLSKRVQFVSKTASPTRAPFLRRNKSELDVLSLEDSSATPQPTVVLPLDLSQLDAEVRAESNGYVMRLSGALDSVARAAEHLTTTQLAKTLDASLASTIDTVYQSQEHTKTLKASFTSLLDSAPSPSSTTASSDTFMKDLDTLIEQVDEASRTRRLSVSRCFSPLRDLLRKMDASSSNLDDSIRQTLHVARVRSVDDVERRYHSWAEEISNLKSEMVAAKAKEVQRLEQLRIEEEKRKEEEERRKREEEDERRRKEEEERKREEERKAEEERQKELERLQEERRRKEAEEAERARLEKERLEEEERERRRLEEEAAKARALEEQERMKQNEEDKARLLAEKLAMQTKLQQAEALLAEEKARQAAREKHAQKLAEEEKLKIEAERKEMQQAIKDAQEQLARIEAEAQKAVGEEKKKLEAEIKAMKAQHDKTLEAYKAAKDSKRKEPKVKETKPRPTKDEEATPRPRRQSASSAVTPRPRRPTVTGRKNVKDQFPTINEDDVFTHSTAPSSSRMATVKENNQTHALISGLRKRLRSLNINEVARPSKKSASLPTRQRAESLRKKFADIEKDVSELPSSYDNNSLNSELRSLLTEVEGSASLLDHIDKLVVVTEAIEQCDTILSDLLEHVDSYPDIPVEISTLHTSDEEATPEQQMEARLTFTRRTLDELRTKCGTVPHDRRVLAEQARLEQTWMELDEMASDRLGGRKSRPPSAISSRPDSSRSSFSSSVAPGRPGVARKRASYAGLSVSSTTRGGKLAPPVPSTRRAVSGDSDTRRSSSRMSSTSTTRSVSGPLSTSVMAPTFASRQRTASLSSNSGTPVRQTPTAGTPSSRSRSRAQSAARLSRTRSPTVSDVSSPSYVPPARSTATSTSSWARAPRDSLSSLVARAMTPPSQRGRTPPPRKKYVANPKSKLDVAVGDVVNSLPVGINVEGVKESWRDQSGKYWIGNQDPKLCFCRILRSQTVMVRVGGGWMELSKFIQNHFADSFKLLPDSPSGLPGKQQDEKWISAASLLEAAAESKNPVIATSPPPGEGSTTGSPQLLVPPAPPKTPEPSSNGPYVPSFSLITPSGQSPRSLMGSPVQSPSVKGSSPLTPLEFMRKAEPIPHFTRPGTPSKASRTRNTPASLPSSSRAAVWRP